MFWLASCVPLTSSQVLLKQTETGLQIKLWQPGDTIWYKQYFKTYSVETFCHTGDFSDVYKWTVLSVSRVSAMTWVTLIHFCSLSICVSLFPGAVSLQTLWAVILVLPVTQLTLSDYDKRWTSAVQPDTYFSRWNTERTDIQNANMSFKNMI